MPVIIATILSLIVGVSGTVIGGITALRGGGSLSRQGWLLGLSGGIMMAVVLFDLWPEAWHFGGLWPTLWGTGVGMALVQYFDRFLEHFPWYRRRQFSHLAKVGILLGLGIGTHNFPEGVALGTTFIANQAVHHWLGLALLMAIHNIPEGMVMAAAFRLGKVPVWKVLIALILVELPMAFGGTTGALIGRISAVMGSFSLSFAAGAMFLLVIKELLPMAKKIAGFPKVSGGFIIGLLIGVLLVRLV